MIDVIVSLLKQAVDALFSAAATLVDVLFFWLPGDPFIGRIGAVQDALQSSALALRWLSWFVDVPFAVAVFGASITSILALAAYRLVVAVLDFVGKVKPFG